MDKYANQVGMYINKLLVKVGAYSLVSQHPIFIGYLIMVILALFIINIIASGRRRYGSPKSSR
jgi:protein-S-isoprenylcysteine O-methyltransferase Ste14